MRTLRLSLLVAFAIVMTAGAVRAVTVTDTAHVVLGGDGPATLPSTAVEALVPGARQTVSYLVGLDDDVVASHLTLAIESLDDTRACPAGACSGEEGRLADVLQIDARLGTVTAGATCDGGPSSGTVVLSPTSVRELWARGSVQLAQAPFSPGDRACLDIGIALPESADNAASGQQVDFRLQLTATEDLETSGEEPTTDVGGVATERPAPAPSAPTGVGPNLPVTGFELGLLLALGLGGLAAGSLALRASRRSRPAPGGPRRW